MRQVGRVGRAVAGVTITSTANAQTIVGTAGSDTIVASGHADTILGGGGADSITSTGGRSLVDFGPGAGRLNLAASSGNTVQGGDGGIFVTSSGGQGNNRVKLGNGADSVHLAGRGNVVILGNGSDTVSAGLGGDSIALGTGANSRVFLAPHDTLSMAGTGVVDATAGYADHITTAAGASVTVLLHGAGNTVTTGGASDAIIDSAIGHNTFAIHGGGSIVLQNFAPTSQIVLGAGDGYVSGADALAHTHDTAAGAVLSFGGGATAGTVLFEGMHTFSLHASDFAVS